MTSVAVFVAMVKLVVRFISLGQVRAKPYIGIARLHRFYRTAMPAVPELPAQRQLAGVIIHVSVMHCNVTRHV